MGFHDVRFPTRLSRGSSGGPERRTEIVTLANGFEARNAAWEHARRRYDAGVGISSGDDLMEILAFFEARRGRLHGFRWKDWLDCKSCLPSQEISPIDQELGQGDGSTTRFALRKAYASGGHTYFRPIQKAVIGTVRVAVDGAEQSFGTGYTFDGEFVELASAPGAGASVTAGFEFDVPVRFAEDAIDVSLTAMEAGEIPSIPVVEVRL
ncbi:phage distal tail protein, Rcc01695 family [Rhodovulum sp. DZ06]|uniref:phage distal tail protein, Rcc01695 family n=1 Tax=Rhodovulum sp. DZ06 TaxID=3425126 RepID=UPI003D342E78